MTKEYFTYIGRLQEEKGIKFLLETWNDLGAKAPKLIVCGDGPLKDWCTNYMKDNNLTNVELLGNVPHEKVLNILSNSKALIIPSKWYEGLPMIIIESLSVNTPIVGRDVGNVGNIIEDGINGYKFNDKEELKEILLNKDFRKIRAKVLKESKLEYKSYTNYDCLIEIYNTLN